MPVSLNQLGQFLHQAGWLPSDEQIEVSHSGDLIPSIHKAWASFDVASLPSTARRGAQRVQAWLNEQMAHGAQLTLLSIDNPRAASWLGERLLWWPHGRFTGSRIGIASSRLGRRLDKQVDWFTVFRAAHSKFNRDQDVVLTVSATTPDRYVRRAAELFGFRVVSMICPRASVSIQAWLRRIRQLDMMPSESVRPACLSPEFMPPPSDSERRPTLNALPLRDRAVVSMAERLFVVHVRHRGRLEQLVRARLDDPTWPKASVFVALGADLVGRNMADDFLDRGAVGWVVLDTLRHPSPHPTATLTRNRAAIVELPPSGNWQWLTHCTRAQSDGWPDQRPVEYLDELLLNRDTADRSAFAALLRIIATRRLVATSRMVRGNTGVVCFTAVPLRELTQLRSFRAHLTRWDFEPYGICIRQDWLAERGCLPVRYGDDALWQRLAEEERPFFQVRASRSRRSGKLADWSIEREWRHVGDVALEILPTDAGLVFVPTPEEADRIATISRWPVTVLGQREERADTA